MDSGRKRWYNEQKELALFVLLDRNTRKTKGYRTETKPAHQLRNRTLKLLALALAAVMVLGMPVSAMEIDENPEGETIDVAPEDTLTNNWGTVTYNNGTVSTNHGTVANNF